MKSERPKYHQHRLLLRTPLQVERAMAALMTAPLDALRPVEFLIREEVKERKLTQQGLMWVGPLADIAEQIVVEGRKFSAKVWHHHLKGLYLPDQYDAGLCISEDYVKWEFDQSGDAVLVGSTTDLTTRGFTQYLEQVFAYGGNMGVHFHEAPGRAR